MITDTDENIKHNMKFISIDGPDIMDYVVNACMKSRIRGNYILRNRWTVPASNIEPLTYAGHYTYKMIIASSSTIWLTSYGTVWKNRRDLYDVIGFQID